MKILFKQTMAIIIMALTLEASAVDGVLEINQTCAVQTGCFAGDFPGFPISISDSSSVTSSSYILTSDLVFPDENTDVIQINMDYVTVDLNGFSIVRQACYKQSCATLTGSGNGFSTGIMKVGITIKNGYLVGTGSGGIAFTHSGTHSIKIENMSVSQSGAFGGISLLRNGTVTGCRVYNNKGEGIGVSKGSTVSGNSVYSNELEGVSGFGALITLNTVNDNSGDGIVCQSCNIKANSIYGNGGDGIEIYTSTFSKQGSIIQDSAITGNGGAGIRFVNSGSAYKGNIITDNALGTVSGISGTGFDLGQNFCTSNDVCP